MRSFHNLGRAAATCCFLIVGVPAASAGWLDDACDAVDCDAACCDVDCCDVDFCDVDSCDVTCCDVGCDTLGGTCCRKGGLGDFDFRLFSGCDSDRLCCEPCGKPAHVDAVHELFDTIDLLGILPDTFFRTDHCFDDFVQPITNPIYFTDPRSISRGRVLFISQNVPDGSVLQGGDLQVYAFQVSAAINERWSIIAEKDGWVDLNTGLADTGGWANLEAGLKYVAYRDVVNQELFTVGILYEIPSGEANVFERPGNGTWNFFGSYGKEIACGSHFIGVFGYQVPDNGDSDTSAVYYSAHFDYEAFDGVYGVVEFNGRTYVDGADTFPIATEGFDLINLGAEGIAGETTVLMAIGAAIKPSPWYEFAAAWEFPISSREDLIENRVTAQLSLFF